MCDENKQDRLTPEAAARIRERANETLQRLDEASALEKQLGVRDPELEEIDREWQEWCIRCIRNGTPLGKPLGTSGTND